MRSAQINITQTTLYQNLVRKRNIPTFHCIPLVALHLDTTTMPQALIFLKGGTTSPTMSTVTNNPVPMPSLVSMSLRASIRLLNKCSEDLHCLGHLNLPPKPSDETLAHTAAQFPELSPKLTIRPNNFAKILNPLNQTPCYEPPLLTFLPTTPTPVQDAHLVQQEALCHRLEHKDQVVWMQEEELCSWQKSCLSSMCISIPYMGTEQLAGEVCLMIGQRDERLRPLTETETSMTDGSMKS